MQTTDKVTKELRLFNPHSDNNFALTLPEFAGIITDADGGYESEQFQLMFCAPGTEQQYERDHLPAIEATGWLLMKVEARNAWSVREAILERLMPALLYNAADMAHLYLVFEIDPDAGTAEQYGEAMQHLLYATGVQAAPVQRIYCSYDADAILNEAAPRIDAGFITTWQRPAVPYCMLPLLNRIRNAPDEFKNEAIYHAAKVAGEYVADGRIDEATARKLIMEASK